jgi:competence protein ComEC
MTLLYLALASMLGIALGRLAWDNGWIGCDVPTWLWLAPLLLLPCTALLNRFSHFPRSAQAPLRWPTHAGFERPLAGPSPALLAALLLCLLVGALRYASQPLTPCWTSADLAAYNLPADQAFAKETAQTVVVGYVSSYPLVADTKQRMQVMVQKAVVNGVIRRVKGELRLNTGIRQRYDYGQPVRIRGRLVTPPDFDDFSYREYLARQGIHSLLYNPQIEVLAGPLQGDPVRAMLYALRSRGEALLNRLLPEPYAALANGMLLGIESGIPDVLYEQFNLTGSSHVIVISGSNVALISGVLMGFGQRLLGRRRALWPTLLGIGGYALLVGGDAAVLRAGLMGSLVVVASSLHRSSTALVSLAFACWVMTLINPLTLWDVGFQLSSAATAGLVLFTPGMINLFAKLWPATNATAWVSVGGAAQSALRGLLEDGLVTTLAANTTTLPLVVYYFGRLSVVSLVTNLLIIPVQPLVMLSGSGGVLIGLLGAGLLAQAVLWFTWLGLVWTVAVVQWTSALPGASLTLTGYGLGSLVVTYLVLFTIYGRAQILVGVQRFFKVDTALWQARLLGPTTAGGVGACALLLWSALLALPDGRLHLYFLDIGQGDGILIQTPSGRQMLIDGGPSPAALFNQLGVVMPFWDRSLDLVALTNPDKDHMEAQSQAPTRFQITTALETEASQANHDADRWRANLRHAGVVVQAQPRGAWLDLGDGVTLQVLWPPPGIFLGDASNSEQVVDNENSLVMRLTYGNLSVLLTGDVGLPAEMGMLAAGAPVQATVLKVGHHGSKGSTSATFLRAVDPQVAIIQVGPDNDYGHPHAEVLERLAGRTLLRNDLHGRIHLYSDGQQLWFETER